MAIEANSASWTGQSDHAPKAPQVCGEFHDREKLDEALSRLEGSLFQRADLSVRVPGREDERSDSDRETPVREDDARNLRQLGVGTASAATAMAAAGVVIATGGAALPAVAAAAAAGGATAAAGEAAGAAAAPGGKAPQHQAADVTGTVLMVHADTSEKQAKAEELLQACGATRIWRQDSA
ncbi:hypothetical protein GCM10011504_22260 [Siccirubricoccus deserti]|uniref:Uncharacterized protein n=1 Tax=Siccirubricoccus deserti TaxID=2013562 RepID=A0A9X0UCV3_9PROT|nr:hypothetical protein [Siccirubricoccus deserti]MBC4015642.1 hypothetical protein [Siccirubricoccus deserti]GGC43398.1 hypothetical protein GCM10011504_22260 [Siccirubricoccus deserti]